MLKKTGILQGFHCVVFLLCTQLAVNSAALGSLNYEGAGPASVGTVARLLKKDERTPVVSTEFGSVSAVDIDDGTGRNNFNLQFITLEPNALFLPVLLHADMVFYVHTGSGTLSWTEGDDINKVSLQRGDVYRLKSGTLFYLYSSLEPERPRFRIIAIFANPDEESLQGPSVGPYSSINDLVRGFDKRVLQAAFQVPEEVIEEITSTTDTPAIVHAETQRKKRFWEDDNLIINAFFGTHRFGKHATDNKKKHTKTFNFFKEDPDFQNCNGWSKVVTNHDLHALHGSDIGVYMVNLTKGSMMGPHWNPTASEISVVLDGEGMVRVVCPSSQKNKDCKNTRIRVEKGDVFAVPRFHPMAQTSFNNGSLVFMGFSTTSKRNHPQFLAGKASVFQILDKPILRAPFNVSNTTIEQMLAAQEESIILECISCAEEQEMLMEEELERGRQQEEERKQREEEARRREEEERRRQEEEAERKREEEQRRQQEEEKRRQKEEEERRRQEEEEQKRRQEEEERRQEEEEQRRREKEERQKEEEEEQRRREKEERQKEEAAEQRRREKEERQQQEEKEQRRQEEEEEQRRQEEEEQRRREKEERQKQEEQRREEEHRRQEEERRTEQEEEERRREERQRQEEEERQRRQEEEQQQEEERGRPGRHEEEERGRGEEESEGEIARREEEERVRRQREEAGRWRDVKLTINKQKPKGKKADHAGRFWRVKPSQDVPW